MKGNNQKLKMLYLVKIFSEYTDDEHALTMQQIIQKLHEFEVNADRKTLYGDFALLSRFGYDIISTRISRETYYHLGARTFELPELKLLVDSVQASKFIPNDKSKALIRKISSLCSLYEAGRLQRQVVIAGRVKTKSKVIYYNVDELYTAIDKNRQVTFHYFQWDIKKRPVLRHDGSLYRISPWSLMWFDEYYYLIGYDAENNMIKHYRVDKIQDLSITDEPRKGRHAFRNFNVAKYARSMFGMYGGTSTTVTVEGRNELAAPLIDRFGTDISLVPIDDEHFTAHIEVIPSRQFLAWIIGLGDGIKITEPESVVMDMQELVAGLNSLYGAD